jgi:hypothetical protein
MALDPIYRVEHSQTAFALPSVYCCDGLHPLLKPVCMFEVRDAARALDPTANHHVYETAADMADGVLQCLYHYKTSTPLTTARLPEVTWQEITNAAFALLPRAGGV